MHKNGPYEVITVKDSILLLLDIRIVRPEKVSCNHRCNGKDHKPNCELVCVYTYMHIWNLPGMQIDIWEPKSCTKRLGTQPWTSSNKVDPQGQIQMSNDSPSFPSWRWTTPTCLVSVWTGSLFSCHEAFWKKRLIRKHKLEETGALGCFHCSDRWH